jgi:hypothetical protein
MKPGDKARTKKLRARLSFSGWIYVLLCLVIGLAAVNSNNNVLFLITSLLLSLLFLSGVSALYNVSGITVRAISRNVLTRGRPGVVMFRLENRKRFSSLVLDVSLGSDLVLIPVIPPGRHKDVFLTWVPPHRGKPLLPPVSLTSSFPFGFVRRGGFFDTNVRPVVSPGPAGRIPELLSAVDEEKKLISTTGQGRGEWNGIRHYRPGEGKASIVWRRVDWHYPSTGVDISQWPAHSFSHELSRSLVLDWDDPLYAYLAIEQRLSMFRSILDKAVRDNESWELRLPRAAVSGMGKVNYEQALQALALVEPLPQ